MAEIRAVLTLEQDGSALPDNPTVRRFNFPETSGEVNLTYPPDNNSTSFHAVVQASMPNLGFVYIASDQAINVSFNGGVSSVPIQASGALLVAGTQLTQAPQINNPALTGGVSANVSMFFAGS